MKIMTVVGTRPEIIRLSIVIEKLDRLARHVLVHTGQNFDVDLKDIFFRQLSVREPDHYLGARGSFGEQVGAILAGCERLMMQDRPDVLLILGDTNSALAAVVAKRLGIPVFHMEAGNRCYDDRVPEEVNRRIIDHSSDILMPYTERSRQNLLREGIPGHRVYVTGNPIREVIRKHDTGIQSSEILKQLGLVANRYFLVTLHRAENVDVEERLRAFVDSFGRLSEKYGLPVIVSTHPRTRQRMEQFGLPAGDHNIRFLRPFGFYDFVHLEQRAYCVLSDSGTVQEECCILRVPNVTLRDVTERPETIECGSNILSGADPQRVVSCVEAVTAMQSEWTPPAEYMAEHVSDTVCRIVLGYHHQSAGPAMH